MVEPHMLGLTKRGGVFKGVSHSLLDQAMLSASNFALGLVFIKFASKHEYYVYSQMIGYLALTVALQGALINTTALTILPQRDGAHRQETTAVYFGLQLALSLAVAVLGAVGIWSFPSSIAMDRVGYLFPFATALMVFSVWLREFVRNVQYINLRPDLCFRLDVAYVTLLMVTLAGLIVTEHVQADLVLLGIAASGILTALPWVRISGLRANFSWRAWQSLLQEVWPLAKWALPAGVVAWAFGNGYLLIGAQVVGPANTAEVVAAKLFMAPLGTLFLSWANVFRPQVSRGIAKGELSGIRRLTYWSIISVFGIVIVYVLGVLVAYPYLESYVLGEKYRGLRVDVLWWAIFFCASGISCVSNGVLLGGGNFRHSFYASVASSVVSIPVMYFMGGMFAKNGLMFGVVLGELTYAAVLFYNMRNLLNVRKSRVTA